MGLSDSSIVFKPQKKSALLCFFVLVAFEVLAIVFSSMRCLIVFKPKINHMNHMSALRCVRYLFF